MATMMQQSEGFFQAEGIAAGQYGVDTLTRAVVLPKVEDLPSRIVHAFEIA
jgi:hypothetical protein